MQDNSEVGIRATISRLSALLQTLDPELWYHLNHKVKVCNVPRYYTVVMRSRNDVAGDFSVSPCVPCAGKSSILCF